MNVIPFGDDQAHGRLGKSVIFERRRGKVYCKTFKKPKDPRSSAQLDQRTWFYNATQAWNLLTQNEKDYWNTLAVGQSYTGYNLFIKNYLHGVTTERIYVTDSANHRYQVFDSAGNFIAAYLSFGTKNGECKNPRGLINANGHSLLCDSDNLRIIINDLSGNFIAEFTKPSGAGVDFIFPAFITEDSSQNIYVVDQQADAVNKFDSNYNYLTELTGLTNPRGITVSSTDRIFFTDLSDKKVYEINSSLVIINSWGTSGSSPGQFAQPWAIAIDDSNYLYITDIIRDKVIKFDMSGIYQSEFGVSGTLPGQFQAARSISVDSLGKIYIADQQSNKILVFDAGYNFLFEFGSLGTGPGQFNNPYGIYFG